MTQPIKRIKKNSPKKSQLTAQKDNFIQSLRENGGNVSMALETAGLARKTAYRHLKEDTVFADAWRAAFEQSVDELFEEARRRAVVGDPKLIRHKNGKVVDTVYEKSDRLLIHLMKHGEAQKKWRGRIVQVGNISINTIKRCGAEIGLSKEQIEYLQGELIKAYADVPLI